MSRVVRGFAASTAGDTPAAVVSSAAKTERSSHPFLHCTFPAGYLVVYRRDIIRDLWSDELRGPESLARLRARSEELIALETLRHAHAAVKGCTCWREDQLPYGETEDGSC